MTDFTFAAHVTRSRVAGALFDNLEQAPYVLAELALDTGTDSDSFEEFCEAMELLTEEQRNALSSFCTAVAVRLAR